MRRFAPLWIALAACGELGEDTQAFPISVDGLAADVYEPGQPVIVLGAGLLDATLTITLNGQVAEELSRDPDAVIFRAPGTAGSYEVVLVSTVGAASDEESDTEEAPTQERFELGPILVVDDLSPLAPATDARRGVLVSWHSLRGSLDGALEEPLGTALVQGFRYGPGAPPVVPFLGGLSTPYALVFRATVEATGGPAPTSDTTITFVDGIAMGTIEPGLHELEVRLLVDNALLELSLPAIAGATTLPGLQP